MENTSSRRQVLAGTNRALYILDRVENRTYKQDGNRLNNPAAITPVTDGENVYVFFKDFGLISYDPAGNVRWRVPLGPFANTVGMAASPIVAGDSIVLV